MSSQSSSSLRGAASTSRAAVRQSPFFRDLASPIPPHHRTTSRFAAAAAATTSASSPPPPPLFTLDDRAAAADFSPDPTDILPPSSPPGSHSSPRGPHLSFSPSFSLRTRSLTPPRAAGSPVDGVVEPAKPAVAEAAAISTPVTPVMPVAAARVEERRVEVANGDLEEEEWVTVFGFYLNDTNLVLREFEKCGVVLRHIPGPRDANWMHILYQHRYDARKALEKNGTQLSSGGIIGVKPVDLMQRRLLNEKLSRINHGVFMVSLPSKSLALKSTAASNQLGALPRPYLPKANTNIIRDSGRRATGSIASPAKSVISKALDLVFGI